MKSRRPGMWMFWVWWHRTVNLWEDLVAVAIGNCNACPYGVANPYGGGGYPHWRCSLARGHRGDHRSENYTWATGGTVTYNPQRYPFVSTSLYARRRYMVRTIRQQRAYDRALREARGNGRG